MGIEITEPGSPGCQPLHVRRAVPVIERIVPWISVPIRQHGNRGVHQSHIIHQEHHDIRTLQLFLAVAGNKQQDYWRNEYDQLSFSH